MKRVIHEFYCHCGKYFDVKLNVHLNGNHRVHCPICEHVHFRFIKNGKITNDRFTEHLEDSLVDDLYPMKAACRDYRKETYEENLSENTPAMAIIENIKDHEAGFMVRRWKEKLSHL